MSIIFPSIKPSQRNFKIGAYPTKAYRSLSGATSKRSYGNKSFGYELRLVFENIDDASTLLILKHYNLTSGGFSRFQLPASVFSGMDEDLRRLVAEDLPNAAPSIRWEYAGPPEVESVISGRSTAQVTLIGEQYGSTSSPITIIDGGGSGGPELPLGISFTGDIILVNNVPTIAPGVIVNDDINSFAAIAFSKLATGALPATITVASANITNDTIVNADINSSAAIVDTKLATIATAGKVSNSATTATNANTASAIVARDASGNFSAGTITAALSGNASTVTTNANLTGDVTSVGNATSIAAGVIVNADVNASAAIATSKLSFLQSGTSAQARTVSDKFRDSVSVLDFIPEAEHAAIRNRTSTYNCAANFQAALDAHTSVYVPAGTYTIGATLNSLSRSCHLHGDGEFLSILKFTGGTHGLYWNVDIPGGILMLKVEGIRFLAGTVMNGSPIWARGQGCRVFLENVYANGRASEEAADQALPNRWTAGFYFLNSEISIFECSFVGKDQSALTGYGYRLDGASIDAVINGCQANEVNIAYDIIGECEGTSITNCTAVNVNEGVSFVHPSPEPLLQVIGCHVNARKRGVSLTNGHQGFISSNLFYAQDFGGEMPGWIGVSIDGGSNLDNIVADNIFGIMPNYTASTKGVYVGDGQRITTQNNIFKNCAIGVELQSNATNCQVVDNIYVGATTRFGNAGTNNYHHYMANGELRIEHSNTSGSAVEIDRTTTDGDLIRFYQAGVFEGVISVAGTTVTYGGGHLARWSQLPDDDSPANLLKGTVMSNLEEMCQWEGEPNEQLNKTMVSSVEGDVNVAGVFVAPSPSDDGPLDFFLAMTGDMIIRIGEGVSVARGDLLMSAGDGTAKPQEDGIVQSKTIAKVVSAHVSCIYNDGSYCVPCVLMAC